MVVVIVPSGEFFFTKTKTEKKNQKKSRLGLTSTYKYKTIHTSVWMLPQGVEGAGFGGFNPLLRHGGVTHWGRFPPPDGQTDAPRWSSQHPVVEWRRGSNGKGESSSPAWDP